MRDSAAGRSPYVLRSAAMRYPKDLVSQRDLAVQLRDLIDTCRRLESADTPAKLIKAETMLNAMLDLNPHAAASSHVLHNIGRARRAWLVEHQRARAGASASST